MRFCEQSNTATVWIGIDYDLKGTSLFFFFFLKTYHPRPKDCIQNSHLDINWSVAIINLKSLLVTTGFRSEPQWCCKSESSKRGGERLSSLIYSAWHSSGPLVKKNKNQIHFLFTFSVARPVAVCSTTAVVWPHAVSLRRRLSTCHECSRGPD